MPESGHKPCRTGLGRFLAVAVVVVVARPAVGLMFDEHRTISESSLQDALADAGGRREDGSIFLPLPGGGDLKLPAALADGRGFESLAARFAGSDGHPSRNHRPGESVLSQLARVSRADLLAVDGADLHEPRASGRRGVLGNYLVHHWLALKQARRAGVAEPPARAAALVRALVLEAMAQGFLQDAHSAGHMLLPGRGLWWPIHGANVRHAHAHHGATGLYVITARGEVWQAFGDGHVSWYPTVAARIVESGACSLREVLVAFYTGWGPDAVPAVLAAWLRRESGLDDPWPSVESWLEAADGTAYLRDVRMPSLLRLPVPVAASWSLPVEGGPSATPRRRFHAPQLREPGYHDDRLPAELHQRLPDLAAVPPWRALPDPRNGTTGGSAPRIPASVRYRQEWDLRPTYEGPLVTVGWGVEATAPGGEALIVAGLGWGLLDRPLPLRKLVSPRNAAVELSYVGRLEGRGSLVNLETTLEAKIPGWTSLHAALGYTAAVASPWRRHGPSLALGLSARGWDLPLGYAGTRLRVRYQWHYLEEIMGVATAAIVVH